MSFKFDDLIKKEESPELGISQPSSLPLDWADSPCGTLFANYMLKINYKRSEGWSIPKLEKFQALSLHPAALVLNYAVQNMETLKCYRGRDDRIRLFRPDYKLQQFRSGAERMAFPPFDPQELLKCLGELIGVNSGWVPPVGTGSLYLRPMLLATQPSYQLYGPSEAILVCVCSPAPSVRTDYGAGSSSVKLWVDMDFERGWPGGVANHKMACVYGPTTKICDNAHNAGCHMPLWVYGPENEITEAGGMNLMIVWRTREGQLQLATPSLDKDLILPGVIRNSLLTLAKQTKIVDTVVEEKITLADLNVAVKEGRVTEMFGCGTGAMLNAVGEIHFKDGSEVIKIPVKKEAENSVMKKLEAELIAIREGTKERKEWVYIV